MSQRQIEKLLRGNRKILVYTESVFVLVLLGGMIFTIDQGNTTFSHVQDQFFIDEEIDSPETLIEQTSDWTINDWFYGFILTPKAFGTVFPQMSAIIDSIDGGLDRWLMHFYTVGFVEYAEFLGILVLYRFVIKTKPVKEIQNFSSKNSMALINHAPD